LQTLILRLMIRGGIAAFLIISSIPALGGVHPNYFDSRVQALVQKFKIAGVMGVAKVNNTTWPDTSFVIMFNERGLPAYELDYEDFRGALVWKGCYDSRDSLVRNEECWPLWETDNSRDTIIYHFVGAQLVKREVWVIDDSGSYSQEKVETYSYGRNGRLKTLVSFGIQDIAPDSTIYEWDNKGNLARKYFRAIPRSRVFKSGEWIRLPPPTLKVQRASERREGKNALTVLEECELEGPHAGVVVFMQTSVRNGKGQIIAISEASADSAARLEVIDSIDISYDERGLPRMLRHWELGQSDPVQVFEYTYVTSSLKPLADRIIERELERARILERR
jgi:hypothetical protein